ncbi:5786_t:CDS:2 [Gigaspora rosea]|nr:5786_t:CDS:2 [Gigaspora rosea]
MPQIIKLKIATLNMKGINDRGKQKNTFTLLKLYKLDIICIQETNMNNQNSRSMNIEFSNTKITHGGRIIETELPLKTKQEAINIMTRDLNVNIDPTGITYRITKPQPRFSDHSTPEKEWHIPLPHISKINHTQLTRDKLEMELEKRNIDHEGLKKDELVKILQEKMTQEILASDVNAANPNHNESKNSERFYLHNKSIRT